MYAQLKRSKIVLGAGEQALYAGAVRTRLDGSLKGQLVLTNRQLHYTPDNTTPVSIDLADIQETVRFKVPIGTFAVRTCQGLRHAFYAPPDTLWADKVHAACNHITVQAERRRRDRASTTVQKNSPATAYSPTS